MKQLVERYRPKSINEYVFKDEHLKNKVESYIKSYKNDNDTIPFPNLLLGGKSGTGKTSLAYILCNECGVEKSDIMYINASRDNNIDTVRNKINNFCSSMANGNFKVVILDEFDRMSAAGQDALKSMFEVYNSAVRFIATANNPEKIIGPLHGRFQVFNFSSLDENTFFDRLCEILLAENISFTPDNLEKIVADTYPDLRKAINVIDQFTIDSILKDYQKEDIELNTDVIDDIIKHAKNNNILKVQELASTIPSYDIENIFVYFYSNLPKIINDTEYYGDACVIIKDSLVSLPIMTLPNILLSATIIQLVGLNK